MKRRLFLNYSSLGLPYAIIATKSFSFSTDKKPTNHEIQNTTKMRLSNDTYYTYAKEYGQHILYNEGERKGLVQTNLDLWMQRENLYEDDDRHFWELQGGYDLVRTTNNCPLEYLSYTERIIENITADNNHPIFVNGFESEAIRLYPKISNESNLIFQNFVKYVKSTYNIDENEEQKKELKNFVDDIGPTIMVILNNKPYLLPEIPPVFKAPFDWLQIMWNINNHMQGPILDENISEDKRIIFDGMKLEKNTISQNHLGLYYLHMSRFILFFEAWTQNPETPSLREFIRLFDKGIDPFG